MFNPSNNTVIANNQYINVFIKDENNQLDIDIENNSIKDKISNCSKEISSLLSESNIKFTAALSKEQSDSIKEIVKKIFPGVEDSNIIIEFKPQGLNFMQDDIFQAKGEPETVDGIPGHYYDVGEIVNKDADETRQMIFICPKRFGAEPGFEAILKKDLMEDGVFYTQAEQLFNDKPPENNQEYAEWINQNLGEIVNSLLEDPKLLNQGLYFIKLDYTKEEDSNEVMIPMHKAKNAIHQQNTKGTVAEKNIGAIMEVLSNDVYRSLGLPSQEAFLLRSTYEDGMEKLLVGCKCVTGKRGEKWTTFEGNIKEGHLVGNHMVGEDKDGNFKIYTLDKRQQALAKMAQRGLADRDGVGGTGGNIGYYIDQETDQVHIVNIDPGKSLEAAPRYSKANKEELYREVQNHPFAFLHRLLIDLRIALFGETDRMRAKDLSTDCIFAEPAESVKDLFQGGYINFSMFDDTTLAENIGAVRELLGNREEANKVFDNYIVQFDQDEEKKEAVENAKKRFNSRLDYFESTLSQRLDCSDNELSILENLEKISSRTTNVAGKKKDFVALQHLKVLPGTRKEWSIVKEEGSITLAFVGQNKKEAQSVLKKIQDFDRTILVDANLSNPYSLRIFIDNAEIENFSDKVSEARIAEHKHQYLLPSIGPFALYAKQYNLSTLDGVRNLAEDLRVTPEGRTPLSREELKSAKMILHNAVALQISLKEAVIKSENRKISSLEKRLESANTLQQELPEESQERADMAEQISILSDEIQRCEKVISDEEDSLKNFLRPLLKV